MSIDLVDLERRALELVKQSDFGPEAIQANTAIVEHAPRNEAAWTRLGRCHLEQRHWDDAVAALRTALTLNPSSTIATNLLNEVRKRRALTPASVQRATTGFSAREFAMLATLSPDEVSRALRPRIEALLDAVNASPIASRIVDTRRRQGETGSKLYHANSFHSGSTGQIVASPHGARWEPQFSIGWFSSPPFDASCLSAGLGFNLSAAARDPDRLAGQERILAFFERFQLALQKSWKQELTRWMGTSAGFIQYADRSPAVDLLPERAVEWLLACRNAAALEWIFVGRWLFLDDPDDAKIMGDRAKLARIVDDTFRTLYPLWLDTYRSPAQSPRD